MAPGVKLSIAIVIGVFVVIILNTIYVHYEYINIQCQTNPTISCYTDWTCENDPTKIGDLDCDNGDCSGSIRSIYTQTNVCADGCTTSECQCQWGSAPVTNSSTGNGSLCSVAGTTIGIGSYLCGEAGDMCPADGEGCNPYCLTGGSYCCNT